MMLLGELGAMLNLPSLRILDELNAGVLEGLTGEEVKDFYSDWYNKRQKDKFRFRYPGTAVKVIWMSRIG